MGLLLDLLLAYLAVSGFVTFVLVRFFRRTEEKASAALIVEFKPRAVPDVEARQDAASERKAA